MASLNPLVIPHSRSPSISSSASSNHPLYDLYPQSGYSLARHNPLHARTLSNSSAGFSFATHITSPADSPPQPDILSNPTHPQSTFKTLGHLGRTSSSRRSRAGSSPYTRTGEEHHSGSSRASSSDAEQDDLAMFYQGQHHLTPQAHLNQSEYPGLFVAPQAGYGGITQQMMGISPSGLDMGNPGGFSSMSIDPEQALEQLAANVRSSTTTTASDRAKQIFVQAWLNANYAPYPDGNVPRQGLYNSYRRVCDQYNIPHINTATLGKAIRLCFPAIKTRRLGVRGNSKYHYCGIRPATVAEAEWLQDFVRRTTNHSAIAASSRRGAATVAASQGGHGPSSDDEDEDESEASSGADIGGQEPSFTFNHPTNSGSNGGLPHPLSLAGGLKSPTLFHMTDDKTPTTNNRLAIAQEQAGMNLGLKMTPSGLSYGTAQAHLRSRRGVGSGENHMARPGTSGSNSSSSGPQSNSLLNNFVAQSPLSQAQAPAPPAPFSVRQLRNFPSINEALGLDSASGKASSAASSPQHVAAIEVWSWFEEHLDGLMESVRGWRFDQFEIHLRTFWASLSGDYREVVHAPAVAALMVKADAVVYYEILEILRTQVVAPVPPQALTSLRQLAEKMENILVLALENYGSTFVEPKVELGARFGHLVLRFLDIFQVTQALSSVLANQKQLADMRRSWSEIDFESIRNQCALVCNCRHDYLVQLLEVDFVSLLEGLLSKASTNSPASGADAIKEVMSWADNCCERLMSGSVASSGGEDGNTMSSRSVLIRWGYVTSQIMRDLTIRSDPAFGAFQILKLFLDDWIALNILRSVALSTNSVQASVDPIQQQYMALSPMPGQEFTGSNNLHNQLMNHTPTTATMLNSLGDPYGQHHLPPSSLSHSYTYSAMSYASGDHLPPSTAGSVSSHGGDLPPLSDANLMSSLSGYSDFGVQGSFDITSFLTNATGVGNNNDLSADSPSSTGGHDSSHHNDVNEAANSLGLSNGGVPVDVVKDETSL